MIEFHFTKINQMVVRRMTKRGPKRDSRQLVKRRMIQAEDDEGLKQGQGNREMGIYIQEIFMVKSIEFWDQTGLMRM